jgi:FlaA1/EpsC-like NDP-sugar epimerase
VRAPISRHRAWQVVVDGLLVAVAWWLAWRLRFAGTEIPRPRFYDRYLDLAIIGLVVAIKVPVFVLSGFYDRWWRYVSTRDMWSVLRGVTLGTAATFVVFVLFEVHRVRVPSGVWFIDLLLCTALVAGARLLARTLIERPRAGNVVARGKEVVVVGAGDAGQLVVREMLRNPALGMTPIGLLDDDPRKKNLRLHGVRVLGAIDELGAVIREHHPDEVMIAIPSAAGSVRERVVDVATTLHVPVKTLPSMSELVTGDADLARRLRPVEVEDLLGREAVTVDLESIAGYLGNACVLVTGAGGSIGSELSRQVARLGPSRLVLVDHAEPALFEIERELARERGFAGVVAVVADVKDGVKLGQVLAEHRPTVIFHAAAYKHVALMEANPVEAVRNNTLGTRTLVGAAVAAGVDRFVLVSTDKAANPQTVMGQSKALCEWIVEAVGHRDDIATRFSAVRFGNVLGSSGSVIPIFRRQIANGGPVTVTHPEMTRFFMTIPEAVQLVVQAGAIAERGQVYVLDMGEPVRILDLAERMISLSGKEPGRDVAITFVGPAPGEKIHEQLVGDGEQVSPSPHAAILRLARAPVDPVWLDGRLAELERLVEAGATESVRETLDRIVSEPQRVDLAAAVGAPPAETTV